MSSSLVWAHEGPDLLYVSGMVAVLIGVKSLYVALFRSWVCIGGGLWGSWRLPSRVVDGDGELRVRERLAEQAFVRT